MSKMLVLGHFLGNGSLKVSNFLHDARRKYRTLSDSTSSEYGGIFGKNLNPGLIRGLNWDYPITLHKKAMASYPNIYDFSNFFRQKVHSDIGPWPYNILT